jgi:ABC-type branched-subunit amino acid transport system substrate-binding protein
MTSAFVAAAEKEVLPVLAQLEVPLVGPLTLDPQVGSPINREVFYLLSGNPDQARALVSWLAQKPALKEGGLAIVYHRTGLTTSVLEAVQKQSEKESLRVPVIYEYLSGDPGAAEAVRQVKPKPPEAIFFLGNQTELLSFLKEAEKLNWFPEIYLQAGGANASVFEAPAGFTGKIFSTVPTSPQNQTADALREFWALAEKYKFPQKHLASQITAFSSAKVLVEALKRAGKELSREKLIQTLEGFYEFQTGLSPVITYGPNRRVGAMGAYVVMVDLKEKKFVPVGGWVGIN